MKQVCGLSCVTILRFQEKSSKYDSWCSEHHKWNAIQPHYTGEKTDIPPSRPQQLTAKQPGPLQSGDAHPHVCYTEQYTQCVQLHQQDELVNKPVC